MSLLTQIWYIPSVRGLHTLSLPLLQFIFVGLGTNSHDYTDLLVLETCLGIHEFTNHRVSSVDFRMVVQRNEK